MAGFVTVEASQEPLFVSGHWLASSNFVFSGEEDMLRLVVVAQGLADY